MVLVVNFFSNFEIKFLGVVVAIFDLVHDVEAIYWPLLTGNSIWKSFLKYE